MPSTYISIIITVYNARKTITPLLKSLVEQTYPKSAFEVILIFEEQDHLTQEIVESSLSRAKIKYLIHIFDQIQGAARSRNQGMRMASGELIAFTDGDCILNPNWLEVISKSVKPQEKKIIGGKITSNDLIIFPLSAAPLNHTYVASNLAFSKRIFSEVEFDPDFAQGFGEDMDFILRAEAKGFRYELNPEMLVEHPAKKITLGMQPKRIFRRQYEVYLHKKHPEIINNAMHVFFRPQIGGKVSLNSLVVLFCLAFLLINSRIFLLGMLGVCFWIFFSGYKNLVISNPNNEEVPLLLRIELIVNLIIYLPLFFLQRIYASIKFRHLVI